MQMMYSNNTVPGKGIDMLFSNMFNPYKPAPRTSKPFRVGKLKNHVTGGTLDLLQLFSGVCYACKPI